MKKAHTTKIAIFRKKEIRKTIYQKEWWFVVNDIVKALTDTPNVNDVANTSDINILFIALPVSHYEGLNQSTHLIQVN